MYEKGFGSKQLNFKINLSRHFVSIMQYEWHVKFVSQLKYAHDKHKTFLYLGNPFLAK